MNLIDLMPRLRDNLGLLNLKITATEIVTGNSTVINVGYRKDSPISNISVVKMNGYILTRAFQCLIDPCRHAMESDNAGYRFEIDFNAHYVGDDFYMLAERNFISGVPNEEMASWKSSVHIGTPSGQPISEFDSDTDIVDYDGDHCTGYPRITHYEAATKTDGYELVLPTAENFEKIYKQFQYLVVTAIAFHKVFDDLDSTTVVQKILKSETSIANESYRINFFRIFNDKKGASEFGSVLKQYESRALKQIKAEYAKEREKLRGQHPWGATIFVED